MERLRHILDLSVYQLVCTKPAATGGVKMILCRVGKVYNFCRRYKSNRLAVSPVMDNIEQLILEPYGSSRHSNFLIKFDGLNNGVGALGVGHWVQTIFKRH